MPERSARHRRRLRRRVPDLHRHPARLRQQMRGEFRRPQILGREAQPGAADHDRAERRQGRPEARPGPIAQMRRDMRLPLIGIHAGQRGRQPFRHPQRRPIRMPPAGAHRLRGRWRVAFQQGPGGPEAAGGQHHGIGHHAPPAAGLGQFGALRIQRDQVGAILHHDALLARHRVAQQRGQLGAAFGGRGVQAGRGMARPVAGGVQMHGQTHDIGQEGRGAGGMGGDGRQHPRVRRARGEAHHIGGEARRAVLDARIVLPACAGGGEQPAG